ncbi:hypothetical protein C8Q73DRAFT_215949 [Cubamyces lactineus]|nr:hypothetical protein C8Q73DRAFT_215949 [Cubamyces lactineus]
MSQRHESATGHRALVDNLNAVRILAESKQSHQTLVKILRLPARVARRRPRDVYRTLRAHLFVSKCACLWTSALTSLHPVAPRDNLRPFLHHGCSVEISEGTPPRHGDNAPILWVHDMLHIHRSVTVTMRSAMGSCNVWDDVLRIFSHSGIRLKISWPAYAIYTEHIRIGDPNGVQNPFQLMIAVAEACERFFEKIMESRPHRLSTGMGRPQKCSQVQHAYCQARKPRPYRRFLVCCNGFRTQAGQDGSMRGTQ